MKKYKLFALGALSLLLLLLPSVLFGQINVFFKAFDYEYRDDFARSIYETSNSCYYVVGNVAPPPSSIFHIMKVDSIGGKIWESTLDVTPTGIQKLVHVGEFKDSLFAVGYFYDTTISSANSCILIFDSLGNIGSFNLIDVCFTDRPLDLVYDSLNIYIVGYCYDSTYSRSNIFLAKIDLYGNKLWHHVYDYSKSEVPWSVDFTPDGGFIIGGDWLNPATQSRDMFLLKTDSLGNAEWHKTYGSNNIDERYGYALTSREGGFAIAGYRRDGETSNGLLVKTDAQGNFLWERLYGTSGMYDYFKFMKQDSNGNYLIAGTHLDNIAPLTPKAWLLKVDPLGDTIWSRYYSYYGPGTHTYMNDIILTSDGGYAMTGYTLGPIPTRNDRWVLKTDSLGRTCDSPPCHAVLWDTQTAVLSLPAPAQATLAPNPTTGQLTLTLAEPLPREAVLTVYDVQGRTRRQWRLPEGLAQYTVQLGLPAGLYLVRLTTEGAVAWSGKVVVE